ncbi:M14 family metallopeptidase [Shewanella sp. HL-SH2]|uniref:N-acetyl-ornithine deacetylase n=1 Tax=Shewanella sp. HL-SH2 TaxID=3436238 RepID=UPI003EB9FC2D
MTNTMNQAYFWACDIYNCQSNDVDLLSAKLATEITRLRFNQMTLGSVDDLPICLYQSSTPKNDLPSVLICAGFHGEEAAGPWGMLHFLQQLPDDILEHLNLSLLPLVNPSGFSHGQRFNLFGENPNRGFVLEQQQPRSNQYTSVEGKLLLQHAGLLAKLSRDGVLTCHEDVLLSDTYLYSFESNCSPGTFSFSLRDALAQYFTLAQDGYIDDCPVTSGVIFNHFDSSFESFLVKLGAKFGACTETPGQQNFDQRILANSAAMKAFIGLYKADY